MTLPIVRLRNLSYYLVLCLSLAMIFNVVHRSEAQSVNFLLETFETEQALDDWFADQGIWDIGVPTFGPTANADGNRAFAGIKCAATILDGNYPDDVSSRLISKAILLPQENQNPKLRFWHWFEFSCGDFGRLEIKVGAGSWKLLTNAIPDSANIFQGYSGGVWSRPLYDLRPYAGQTVQFGFYFESHNDPCNANGVVGNPVDVASGWYLDLKQACSDSKMANFDVIDQ